MKLLRHPDVLAGLIFAGLGAAFFVASLTYEFGRAVDMGPGFFPRIVGAALLVLALPIGLRGLIDARRRDGASGPPVRFALGPIVTVGVALALFSLTLRSLGYVVAALLLVAVAGAASRDRRWKEVALLAIALALAAGVLFVLALKLQVPLWPAL
jgi:Tripartite tricarboxylate transporter TctB family